MHRLQQRLCFDTPPPKHWLSGFRFLGVSIYSRELFGALHLQSRPRLCFLRLRRSREHPLNGRIMARIELFRRRLRHGVNKDQAER